VPEGNRSLWIGSKSVNNEEVGYSILPRPRSSFTLCLPKATYRERPTSFFRLLCGLVKCDILENVNAKVGIVN